MMKSVSLVLCIQSQFIQHKNLGSEKLGVPKNHYTYKRTRWYVAE